MTEPSPARQRTIYCSEEERAAIGARAEAAGMSFSRFILACALHGPDEEEDAPRLVLSEDEQRALCRRVELLDRCSRALLERLPEAGMSVCHGLGFLIDAELGRREGGG